MAVTFEGFSAYARLGDPQLVDDSERFTAELCLRAAMDHARGTGIPADKLDEEDNAKFELYIYAMASHWFDNRAFNSSEQSFSADEYIKREMRKMHIELKERGFV